MTKNRNWKKYIILIFLLTFFIRFLFIGRYFGQDEVYYVGYTTDILKNKPFQNVFPPFLEFFLLPFLLVFGESEIVIHILLAAMGALTVALVFYIGNKFFNFWVGLIAAVLMAFNTTHWFFSNFAMLDVPATLFVTIGMYFLWTGYKFNSYKNLYLGSIFTAIAVATRYYFFPAAVLVGYLILFDRKKLFNKKIILAVALPFIVFGLWMLYFITQARWLWDWWSQYFQGQLGYDQPFYFFAQRVFDEYFLQIPAFFILLFTTFLFVTKFRKIKNPYINYTIPTLILIIAILLTAFIRFDYVLTSVIGALTVAVIFLYQIRKGDFNKFLSLYLVFIFVFFSAFGVKYARYVMPALPALYLLVGNILFSLKNYKFGFIPVIAMLLIFVVFNSVDVSLFSTSNISNFYLSSSGTINKLIFDASINDVKFEAQKYINENSDRCSQVYSKTWYGFYYLRDRITDLPSDSNALKNAVKANCNCPPKFVVSEGVELSDFQDVLQKDKEYSKSATTYIISNEGFKEQKSGISPVIIYKIKEEVVDSICKGP